MEWEKNLFDRIVKDGADRSEKDSPNITREVLPLDRLKNLEEKITGAVERVKALKDEKSLLERKVRDLESLLNEKNQEIEALRSEKSSIGNQIAELLNQLEAIEN
jgi:chromosome segregation ATPase